MKNFVMKMLITLIVSIISLRLFPLWMTRILFFPLFQPVIESFIDNVHILRTDIEDIIFTLDSNKAVGPDLVSHKLLKNTSRSICTLFNRSLNEGIFPSKWKSAHVLPLFKKGDKHSPGHYRPVSLSSCLSKLMERCIYK